MATKSRDSAASRIDAASGRIRDLNDRIIDRARRRGEASLDAYERLLNTVAEAQETAGGRGAEWVRAFGKAQASFTRELADALPAAARALGERATELRGRTARQARRVPGVEEAEGEVRGTAAREEDLPIRNYDELNANEVNRRLSRLSKRNLRKIDAYERKHRNRKTVRNKIESLTS
jgi:hypothetical protein